MGLASSPDGRFVRANGLRHHLFEWAGDGPPLVVVPGITTPAGGAAFWAREFAPRWNVFALDVRGRGLSDRASDGYSLSRYAADLAAVTRALELDRPVLLGHSMGARIVAACAAADPRLARAVVAVDPPLSGPGRAPYPSPLEPYLEQIAEAQTGTATFESLRARSPGWSEEALRARLAWIGTCDPEAVEESYRGFHEEDFFEAWSRILEPVLLVRGAESEVVRAEALDELRAMNPHAELVTVPTAGHMIPWDNLPGFLKAVGAFLDRVAGWEN